MTGRDEFNTILPNDFSFCKDLDTIIREEPIDFPRPRDPEAPQEHQDCQG